MDRPCIVCQENCPVSPKAISTREVFNTVNTGSNLVVEKADAFYIEFRMSGPRPDEFATGDYYCVVTPPGDGRPRRIIANWERGLRVSGELPFNPHPQPGNHLDILIKLQQPYVDPKRCIGCGVCEHECPVPGKRAIRVTADGESRDRNHSMLLRG
jgi:formate hydrogenlyase subunit 6/NADH:ubiquinone oxidoreductase subunit I